MSDHRSSPGPSFSWENAFLRAVIPGLLIALAGFVGEWVITSASSKAENARLVTNLQIQREQAESDLRKDVFGQAVAALIGTQAAEAGRDSIEDHSKRLLKLELLALNFGDSIFLSPLFAELEKDLRRHMASEPADRPAALELLGRLRSLAQRVASAQLSFLAQRGSSVRIQVPLTADGQEFCNDRIEYKWPDDLFTTLQPCAERPPRGATVEPVVYDGRILPVCPDETDGAFIPVTELQQLMVDTASIALDKPEAEKRFVTAVFSEPRPERKSVRVSLLVCGTGAAPACNDDDPSTVKRTFTLDYFNFPTIDNTRLPSNERFAVVLEDFALGGQDQGECPSTLDLSIVLFPSEHASLRDRPTMRESLQILERAQGNIP